MKKIFIIFTILAPSIFINGQSCQQSGCCPCQNVRNPITQKEIVSQYTDTKKIIQEAYGNAAKQSGFVCQGGGCCGGGKDLSQGMGYSKQELEMFSDANLGLGCGHPVGLTQIKESDTVLDLGSGAGLDCFLAARKVGKNGKVIGVDMTEEMIHKARQNAATYKFSNVEFRLGDIENLPVSSNSVDVIMSNCVINLAPNKAKVFSEAHRVLKPGGKMAISDVVLTQELTKKQQEDKNLLTACVSGALLKKDYLAMLSNLGFTITIIDEDKEINKKWFNSSELPITSLKFVAHKK